MTDTSDWLDPAGLAEWLDVPVRTVYAWRSASPPRGPRGYRIGRHVRYRRSDVETWLESNADPQSAA